MARYRKTSNDRVGRDISPTPTPTPTPTAITRTKNNISSAIDSKVSSTMPEYADLNVDVTIDDFIAKLSDTQKRAIAELLRKARFSINTLKDVDTILADVTNFSFDDTDLRSFNKFVNSLSSQLVFKGTAAGGPRESVSITKYGPEQIDSWVDDWLVKKAGRTLESLNDEQAKLLRRAVKDYASGESVTTVTKDKKGRAVTTYRPAVSEAGIEQTLEEAGGEMFASEMERRQAFEFGDILSKTLGIGSI